MREVIRLQSKVVAIWAYCMGLSLALGDCIRVWPVKARVFQSVLQRHLLNTLPFFFFYYQWRRLSLGKSFDWCLRNEKQAFLHSIRNLSRNKSIYVSKASSPKGAIYCFLLQRPVFPIFFFFL